MTVIDLALTEGFRIGFAHEVAREHVRYCFTQGKSLRAILADIGVEFDGWPEHEDVVEALAHAWDGLSAVRYEAA